MTPEERKQLLAVLAMDDARELGPAAWLRDTAMKEAEVAVAERCATCRFWHSAFGGVSVGNCQRRAPIAAQHGQGGGVMTHWPQTAADNHCGDYQVDPEVVGTATGK